MSDQTTIEVVLSSESTVGNPIVETVTVVGTVPIGPRGVDGVDGTDGVDGQDGEGVPTGGTAGQILTKDSGTDFDTSWQDPAAAVGAAPDDATYLTTTAHSGLTSEVVVGATPGGELGGTWASPTVDATHSGSSHASVQAAAEATAAAALSAHEADTTNVHGIANTALLETTAGAQAKADAKVTQTITNGVTTTAPSEDAVFDALALKQPLDADLTALAAAGNSAVLAATTASFLTADETKLDHLTVTQAVDLDAIETRVNALDAAVVLKGTWDASAGTFPGGGTAQAGDSYIVSVAGTVDSVAFSVNDRILAIVDNASTGTYAANWLKLDYTDQVLSVAGQTGAVTLAKGDVGLGNVDNTSDANKPVSTAQQTAIDAKVSDTAYDATSWNGVTDVAPSKNAVRDELEQTATEIATAIADGDASTLTSAQTYADGKVSDTAYNESSWNAVTGIAPSKNAVRDQIEALASIYQPLHADLTDLAARWVAASASGPASLDFLEDTDNGSNYARVIAPAALGGDRTLTLPDETGTLVSTGSLGVYTGYTPTFTQGASTLTTSSLVARYNQTGKRVHAWGRAVFSNAGTANQPIQMTYPLTAHASLAGLNFLIGTGHVEDTGAIWMPALIGSSTTSAVGWVKTNGDAQGFIGQTPNFAVASGDTLSWDMTYEAV